MGAGVADPGRLNDSVWARGRFVAEYANRRLRPVEVMMLVRHREDLSGRVLELGPGGGRIAGYLVELARELHGLDLSERMVAECRRRYPRGHFRQGDMRDLSWFEDGSLDAVIAANNLLDVFADPERRATLREIGRTLRPGGLLVMSSHNRYHLPQVPRPGRIRTSDPLRLGLDVLRAPRRLWRHRRLAPLERSHADYAIVSDGSHGFSLLHYYVTPEAQHRQLEQEGYEPLRCADLDDRTLGPGDTAPECPELHYFARRR